MFRTTLQEIGEDTTGTATVEYTVLMVCVTIGAAAAIYAIGMPLVERYRFMKLLIGLPLP